MYPEYFDHNPLYPDQADFKVVVKDDMSGMGVKTFRDFSEGELVAHMTGDIIHDIRQHSLQIDETRHLYDTWFSGYFLHSCNPNIKLDMQNLTVHAIRPIKAGEFLYMDYAQTEARLYKQFPCSCGAVNCRGWITGHSEQVDEADPGYQAYMQICKIAV